MSIEELERTMSAIDPGDATIRGTGIAAHRIAALVEAGMRPIDILSDYPNLSATQIEAAVAYAQANPRQGQPYPDRTVKSALRRGHGGLRRAFAAARDGG